jgi:hypothetical protein
MQNILVVNNGVDARSKLPSFPVLEPKSDLLIRYEPDTKKMFISASSFKSDCVKIQINYKETYNQLVKKGIVLGSETKRLAKGTKIVAPGVRCIVFNCENPDFIGLEGLVPAEVEDVGGQS